MKNLTNKQIQVLLTGTFGDSHVAQHKTGNFSFISSCIHEDYMRYKGELLGDLWNDKIISVLNKGYKESIIYKVYGKRRENIAELHLLSLADKLSLMDDLGVALWFFDDGSLHKRNHFYNLNTHSFPRNIQEELFVPFFKRLGLSAKIYPDKKKDGRLFHYLSFNRVDSYYITELLRKHYVSCFEYKMWSKEVTSKWGKTLEILKEEGRVITPMLMGRRFKPRKTDKTI